MEDVYRKQRRSVGAKLPHGVKNRLNLLFRALECEFETLYIENERLHTKISQLEKLDDNWRQTDEPDRNVRMLHTFSGKSGGRTIKTHRNKLAAHTSKIVSNFKSPTLSCSVSKVFEGHRDGLWDVAVSFCQVAGQIVGTASADRSARIWSADSGKCLSVYIGHTGSVNSVSFHPSQDLVLSSSGDNTAHIWSLSLLPEAVISSDETTAVESCNEDIVDQPISGSKLASSTLRQPISVLKSGSAVVINAQWMADGEQVVSASWDRNAYLYDVAAPGGPLLLQSLIGHDEELTHVAVHPVHRRLVATSSNDSTFRLWDFRDSIHSVSVFQGHTDSVTCAVFTQFEQIVSGSDDRTVKVWDLRNMRTPVTNVQTNSSVNKLSVSALGIIAVPHDNRNIVLYDLRGQWLLRLRRDSSKSSHHRRSVTAATWSSDGSKHSSNLFTSGFDKVAFGWAIRDTKNPVIEESHACTRTLNFKDKKE